MISKGMGVSPSLVLVLVSREHFKERFRGGQGSSTIILQQPGSPWRESLVGLGFVLFGISACFQPVEKCLLALEQRVLLALLTSTVIFDAFREGEVPSKSMVLDARRILQHPFSSSPTACSYEKLGNQT